MRGPSEENNPTGFAAPVNGTVPVLPLFQNVAATLCVFAPALWPKVVSGVAMLSAPRSVSRCSARVAVVGVAVALYCTITTREPTGKVVRAVPAALVETTSSYGSVVPVCRVTPEASTVVPVLSSTNRS